MRFSRLQKYILLKSHESRSQSLSIAVFCDYYQKTGTSKGKKIIRDIIHQSLISLVDRNLVIAFGRKTAKKFYIEKVRLTRAGRQKAIELIKKRQSTLPF